MWLNRFLDGINLNVLFLSELFYPHGGGAELATYLYAKLLAEAKVNVVVVTNRFGEESEFSDNEGFRVYRLPLFSRAENVKYSILRRVDVLLSSFMRKFLRWADVVYVPRFWFSAIPVAKAYGKPVITHLHDYIPVCPLAVLYNSTNNEVCQKRSICTMGCIYAFERMKRPIKESICSAILNLSGWNCLRKAIDLSDAILCVSKAQKNIILKSAPQLESKSKVIYNPLPSHSQIPLEGKDFGYFGGPSVRKGFPILRKAVGLINDGGSQRAIIHATKFTSIKKHLILTLERQGFLLHGKLDEIEYQRLYRRIRTVVVPSTWPEPWPYVIVEAIVNCRLVVATDIGGISEQIEGCRGITTFNRGDYRRLADGLLLAMELDDESVTEVGSYNREIFLKKYNTENTIRAFVRTCEVLTSSLSLQTREHRLERK